MQRRERRALERAQQSQQARGTRRFPTFLVVSLGAVILVVGGLLATRFGQTGGLVGGTPTPQATVAAVAPTVAPEPTEVDAAFLIQDQCVTGRLETPSGPVNLVGGGLQLQLQVTALSEMSAANNLVVAAVCGLPLSRAELDALIARVAAIPGVTVVTYSYGR